MKSTQQLESEFIKIGREFERKFLYGFALRKPKKIITHAKQILRLYRRETSFDIFTKLSGTILIWRYAMMSKTPKRELIKLERFILRSFHFVLKDATVEEKDIITYLFNEQAGPGRSVMGLGGSPLRHMLELKLLEFQITDSKIEVSDRDKCEIRWKDLYENLSRKFRFRILIASSA